MECRIKKIKNLLPNENTAIYIVSGNNRFYFTGFRSSDGFLYITYKKTYLLVDSRYYEAAKKQVSADIEVVKFSKISQSINIINKENDIKYLILEEDAISISDFGRMKKIYDVDLIIDFGLSDKILNFRMIKSINEINNMRIAQQITEKAYLDTLNILKPGISEREISLYLENKIKVYGGEKVSFDLITITGTNTSLPHGVPGNKIVKAGDFFTFDIGTIYEGYCSDMTRTVGIENVSDKQQEVYNIVLEAHNKAMRSIVCGNKICDVDLAARKYIESRGYGDCFGHSTGHGVGLDIHEKPVVYKSNDNELLDGMVITDEPGIYIENEFGVRIEDMVLVTNNGPESFAKIDKNLVIV